MCCTRKLKMIGDCGKQGNMQALKIVSLKEDARVDVAIEKVCSYIEVRERRVWQRAKYRNGVG